jgi:phage shock protein A
MAYFSRLTDIVTCNLTEILANEADPVAAVDRIIFEMQEGITGAQRSVKTATLNVENLEKELSEQKLQVTAWQDKAKDFLMNNDEDQARDSLARKQELEALIAGLEQQFKSAVATKNHLLTTQKALEARHAEALRKKEKISQAVQGEDQQAGTIKPSQIIPGSSPDKIDEELEALKKELLG